MRRVAPCVLCALIAACGDSSSTLPQQDAGAEDALVQDDAAPAQDDAATACSQPPRKFWTWNLAAMPPGDKQVQATCRGETAHGYVYVADDVWGSDIDDTAVQQIMQAFETATPAQPSAGMYAIDTTTYGDPPDVDGDPHITLLYMNIAGYGSYTFDGFFRADDEVAGSTSNHMEMLHLNAASSNAPASPYMLGVAIHEMVHLIAYNYDDAEEVWLSESLAESAMTIAGYLTDLSAGRATARDAANTALAVTGQDVDYGAAFLFGSYLAERFGAPMLRALVQDPSHGIASVEAQMTAASASFKEVFGDFMTANLLDQPAIEDGRFGYTSFDLTTLGHETAGVLDGAAHTHTPAAWGAQYLRFTPTGAGTVTLQLDSPSYAKLVVRTATFDPAHPEAAQVAVHPLATASETFAVTVAAGQVVDLVVAVYWGSSIASQPSGSTNRASFSYTASFAP
ncbi:MAG TPA: hypothetical protein VGQ83_24445 [Polyangia bacterium]|jgi:hypothetical protein